ncbi:hypothetical protein FNF31_06437 [Cafeteria roenbergensis]|uniref:Uncharacterized protein n=1 Tax=Cafeteria roenbergensis TaxID=33653 RepID=A0A5A8C3A1_CAFRO|nr:hypothetical protein FNF28_07583 [Cafeteria roenbergensis]KAA0153734.1 hypothetical protein FNF31_06437 [Cafeteria roenbergensis]
MAAAGDRDPFADPFAEEDPDLDFVSVAGGSRTSSFDMPGDDHTFISSGLEGSTYDPYPDNGGTDFVSIGGKGPSEPPADDAAREAEAAIERPNTIRDTPLSGPNMMDQAFGAVNKAMFGPGSSLSGSQQSSGAKYLAKTKSRSLWETGMHNAGAMYLAAGSVGMSIGIVAGVRTAKNFRPRILVNSVLNSSGRTGARLANGAAALAMFYTGITYALDQLEFDAVPSRIGLRRQETYTPMAATALALLVFRSPLLLSGSPAQRLGAAITPILGAGCIAAIATAAPVIGPSAPFRWN